MTEIVGTTHVVVMRGYAGTHARPHASGALVFSGTEDKFASKVPTGYAVAADGPYLPLIVLAGSSARAFRILNNAWVEVSVTRLYNVRCVDQATGYEYLLVETSAAVVVGEWVVITGAGNASQLAAASKGRVGIVIEAAASSDLAAWVIVVGSYASALTTSDVTTAADMIAGTGAADILTSTGGNIIWGAAATVNPSTATSPTLGGGVATVYLLNPWVSGEVHSFSSVGT